MLSVYTLELRLVWKCLQVINQLATNNKVFLLWVYKHERIPGKEEAICLAKEGAGSDFVGPELLFGVPRTYRHNIMDVWEQDQNTEYWTKYPGPRQNCLRECLVKIHSIL